MGGKAFKLGPNPLETPRMPPDVYYRLRNHYLSILSTLYLQVETPIEAPSKDSFGDIDILVSQPQSPLTSTPEALGQALASERTFTTSGSPSTSFAVPYPNFPGNHVQLDVHVCPPSTFRWAVFHQSHGDLWNLLGTTIRPFGLTANDTGLHLRIAEIEELNRKRSMIWLTSEPEAILNLLNLDAETYRVPFESVETLYEYVVSCRFFRGETYVRGDLKANDRKRLAQRELYRRFVDVWLPKNETWVRTRIGREPTLMREDVTEIVLKTFDKREEWQKVTELWRREQRALQIKSEGRQNRKAEALEAENYANAWIEWIKQNALKQA